ncbi:uncharacterized protein LOC110062679 [Orbicella faveolata]|uniref:uncharacterized protein LOC110062679 n=1 Tax=Orbicella faveolata TaxID=48498 RepID=UPI0009E46435|nr:uncharacterized protein LOC110062679 [Orbicella faveolata]
MCQIKEAELKTFGNVQVVYEISAAYTSSLFINLQKTTFRSKFVCDEGGSPTGGSGLSTGSVLLIVFFVLLFVYLIAGLLYNKYRKGVQSLPEMVPNYSFWADFPFLVKDGCVFTFQGMAACCKRLCMKMKGDSYASI